MRRALTRVVAALALVGCADPVATGDAADASPSSSVTAPSSATETASSSIPSPSGPTEPRTFAMDPDVVKLVKAIATGCDVDEARASVRDCRAHEDETLGRYVEEKKPSNLYGTAARIALGDGAKNKKLFAAAVHAFHCVDPDRAVLERNATPGAVAEVTKLLPLVGDGMDAYFARGAAAVLLVGGKRAELTALLRGGTVQKRVARSMWTWYLAYGGADAIADLEETLKSDDKLARYNAASAPSAALATLGEPDRTKVCAFAQRVIDMDDAETIGPAADALAACGGAYSDAALDALAKKTSGPTVPSGVIQGLHHQCWARGVVGGKINGTPAQCARAVDLLVRITAIKDLDPTTLATALWTLGHTGKNGGEETFKKAKATLAKFLTHKDKGVQESAKTDYSR